MQVLVTLIVFGAGLGLLAFWYLWTTKRCLSCGAWFTMSIVERLDNSHVELRCDTCGQHVTRRLGVGRGGAGG